MEQKTPSKEIKFKEKEMMPIDLNAMFNLTFNYDMLKNIIEFILKSQKELKSKIKNLSNEIHDSDRMQVIQKKISSKSIYPIGEDTNREGLSKKQSALNLNLNFIKDELGNISELFDEDGKVLNKEKLIVRQL